jgi:hypothetical protein
VLRDEFPGIADVQEDEIRVVKMLREPRGADEHLVTLGDGVRGSA